MSGRDATVLIMPGPREQVPQHRQTLLTPRSRLIDRGDAGHLDPARGFGDPPAKSFTDERSAADAYCWLKRRLTA